MPAPPGGFHVTGHDPQLYRRPGFYNIVILAKHLALLRPPFSLKPPGSIFLLARWCGTRRSEEVRRLQRDRSTCWQPIAPPNTASMWSTSRSWRRGVLEKCHSHFPYMLRMRTAFFKRQLTSMRCPCAGRRRRHPHAPSPSDAHRRGALAHRPRHAITQRRNLYPAIYGTVKVKRARQRKKPSSRWYAATESIVNPFVTFAACNLSGTKSSYLAGRRRFNGGCTAYAKRPQAPICGPSGTGFAVADPWNTFWRPADVMELSHLKHERLLDSPSPWSVHAETIKRTHGHVTSLLEAPLATAPGQPVPHHRQWWVLGWQIRRMAVSRDATVRHPGLGSLPSSRARLVCPWQLLHLHENRIRLCFTRGWRLRWGPFDVHIQSHPPWVPWLHAKWWF